MGLNDFLRIPVQEGIVSFLSPFLLQAHLHDLKPYAQRR